jgi:hypothetical protein
VELADTMVFAIEVRSEEKNSTLRVESPIIEMIRIG